MKINEPGWEKVRNVARAIGRMVPHGDGSREEGGFDLDVDIIQFAAMRLLLETGTGIDRVVNAEFDRVRLGIIGSKLRVALNADGTYCAHAEEYAAHQKSPADAVASLVDQLLRPIASLSTSNDALEKEKTALRIEVANSKDVIDELREKFRAAQVEQPTSDNVEAWRSDWQARLTEAKRERDTEMRRANRFEENLSIAKDEINGLRAKLGEACGSRDKEMMEGARLQDNLDLMTARAESAENTIAEMFQASQKHEHSTSSTLEELEKNLKLETEMRVQFQNERDALRLTLEVVERDLRGDGRELDAAGAKARRRLCGGPDMKETSLLVRLGEVVIERDEAVRSLGEAIAEREETLRRLARVENDGLGPGITFVLAAIGEIVGVEEQVYREPGEKWAASFRGRSGQGVVVEYGCDQASACRNVLWEVSKSWAPWGMGSL